MKHLKKQLFLLLILITVISMCACSDSTNVISSAVFEKSTVTSQESTGLTVQIANSAGKTQVIDTDVIRVLVKAPKQFTVEPTPGSAETLSKPNELKVSLKPGAVLPRDFKFNITANGAQAGEYAFTVVLNQGGDDEASKDVSLTVE